MDVSSETRRTSLWPFHWKTRPIVIMVLLHDPDSMFYAQPAQSRGACEAFGDWICRPNIWYPTIRYGACLERSGYSASLFRFLGAYQHGQGAAMVRMLQLTARILVSWIDGLCSQTSRAIMTLAKSCVVIKKVIFEDIRTPFTIEVCILYDMNTWSPK